MSRRTGEALAKYSRSSTCDSTRISWLFSARNFTPLTGFLIRMPDLIAKLITAFRQANSRFTVAGLIRFFVGTRPFLLRAVLNSRARVVLKCSTSSGVILSRGVSANNRRRARLVEHNHTPAVITIDAHMMARSLCERLNLSRNMGPGSTYMAVYDVAKLESDRGGDLEKLCDRMEQAYRSWMEEASELEYQWGVPRFFGDGWWDRPSAWPRKSNHRQHDKTARRDQKWEEFVAKESEHETQ